MPARLSHEQNRARCVAHDSFQGMSLTQLPQRCRIAPAENDQIGLLALSLSRDFNKWNAGSNHRFAPIRWNARAFAQVGEIAFRRGHCRLCVG